MYVGSGRALRVRPVSRMNEGVLQTDAGGSFGRNSLGRGDRVQAHEDRAPGRSGARQGRRESDSPGFPLRRQAMLHEIERFDDAVATRAAPIRVGILIVNANELLAQSVAVALGLDADLCVVAVGTDDDAGLIRVLASRPDVVIVDGLGTVTHLRDELPTLRLFALSPHVDRDLILDCIRAGVDGCTSMDTSPHDLGQMIRRIHAGEAVYATRLLLELLNPPRSTAVAAPRRTAKLAQREIEVLTMTATGLPTAEAADALGISVHTFRTHLKHILAKLEARSKLEAVLIALREGRIQLPDDAP